MISAFVLTAAVVSRSVIPAAPGPNRLDADVALLAGTSAPLRYTVITDRKERRFQFDGGLDDLRLRDANGSEVQYLLIAPPTHAPLWKSARSILPIPSTKTTSGLEADLGSVMTIDRLSISGVDTPFLKRVRLDGSGDRVRWTVLAAETTLFDLPERDLRNLEVAFAPGDYRYLRFVWDDRSSARVRHVGAIAARVSDPYAPPPAVSIPLGIRGKASEAGKSRYRLTLPGPHLPVAGIELRVSNPNVFRDASVSEPRLQGSTLVPVELGSGTLRRAERDGTVAARMEIPITSPSGPDLDLLVDDGNSGPLDIKEVVAHLAPLPWIYFETAASGAVTVTYGDPSLRAPRYDLEALRRSIEKAHPPIAAWQSATATAAHPSVGVPLPITGAPIDPKPFRRSRGVGRVPRGLISLILDADVLTHSRALEDVRLVDPTSRQVPYLLERRDAPLPITLRVPVRTTSGSSSVYRFELPYDRFPSGTRLVVTTTARVFDRNVIVQRPADESHGREADVLERAEWRSADPDSTPPELTFTAPLPGSAVELCVDEGDNAPLPIASAQLLLPSYALRFFSSGRPLTILYDDPSASPPRYDLALLAPRLLGESAREVTMAPMVMPGKATARKERVIFWGVIGAATVILLVTLARLLGKDVTAEGA